MQIKNEGREKENEIKVFSPNQILNKEQYERTHKKESFFGYIFSSSKDNGYRLYRKSIYRRRFGDLWRDFKTQIVSGVVTIAAVAAVCVTVGALDFSLGYEVIVDGENIGVVTNKDDV